jgi:lyso-ornithine lipid O-acyltransferase
MSRLRATLVMSGFLALTLPLMPVQYLLLRASPKAARRFPHHYHRVLARLLGVRVIMEGPLPQAGTLLAPNHVSWIDIVALSAAMPLSFIAKQEVRGWPLFGQMARLQNTVFVNRQRRHSTGTSRDDISSRLKNGDTLVLFAEGTSHDGVNVLPFKSSFFAAAEAADVGVIPVTLSYNKANGLPMTHRERPLYAWYGDMNLPPHLWSALKHGPVTITIRFHEPLPPADRKELAQRAETMVRESLAQLGRGR